MQRTETRAKHRRLGNGLVTVLVVTFAVSSLLVTVVHASIQRAFIARRLADRIRAQAIAEAGVSQAYATLTKDFDTRTNADAFPPADYAGGQYEVTVTPIGEDTAVIESVGELSGVRETTILDVRMYGGDDGEGGGGAYGYAILADGQISWTGCGVFISNALIHANDVFKQAGCGELNADISSSVQVTLKGNSGEIDGDATAPSVDGKTGKITGTITEEAVPEIEVPQIDLAPYYNEALKNGEVYGGSVSLSSAYAPVGGIMWVNGNLSISGPNDIEGCFIATGDIHCSGSGGQTQVEGYPGFVSRDGNIKFSGCGTYEGLVYARIGAVEIVGSGTYSGSVICGGDFKKAGSSTVIAYRNSAPVAPGALPSQGVLCVSAWQK